MLRYQQPAVSALANVMPSLATHLVSLPQGLLGKEASSLFSQLDQLKTLSPSGGTSSAHRSLSSAIPVDDLLADFLSVACDATGQYVAATSQYVSSSAPASIFLSQDYGNTFSQTFSPNGTTSNDIAIAANAPNYLVIVGTNGITTSTDFGLTFQQATIVPPSSSPTPSPSANWKTVAISSNASHAYAIVDTQIYRSTDYLNTFSLLTSSVSTSVPSYANVATSSTGEYVYITAAPSPTKFLAGSSTPVIYYSHDFGDTLSPVTASLGYGSPSAIACSSTGQYVTLTTTFGSIYLSSNYGLTWMKSVYSLTGLRMTDVAISSNGQIIAVVAPGPSIYLSLDSGKSFSFTTSSTQSWISISISANGQSIYTVPSQSGHLFLSHNTGSSWVPLYYPWYGIAISPQLGYGSAFVTLAVVNSVYDSAVYLSRENGTHWQAITDIVIDALPDKQVPPKWIAAASSANGESLALTTEDNLLLLSIDYGKTWSSHVFGQQEEPMVVMGVSMSVTGQYVSVITNKGPLYVSSDYGSTFTSIEGSSMYYWDISMSYDGMIQIATTVSYSYYDEETTGGYVYMSIDYGLTWQSIPSLPYSTFWSSVSMDSTGTYITAIQAEYNGSVYYSHDSGKSWSISTNPPIPSNITANYVSVCQSSNGRYVYLADGVLVGSTGTTNISPSLSLHVGQIYASIDYGVTWYLLPESPVRQWVQISCDSTGQYVSGTVYNGQIYTTADWGDTWIPQNITVIPIGVDTSTDDDSSGNSSSDDDGLSKGEIVAIVIVSTVIVILLSAVIYVLLFGVSVSELFRVFCGCGRVKGDNQDTLLANPVV